MELELGKSGPNITVLLLVKKIRIDLKWIFGSVCVTEKGPVWTSQIPISSPDRAKFSRFDGFLSQTQTGSLLWRHIGEFVGV